MTVEQLAVMLTGAVLQLAVRHPSVGVLGERERGGGGLLIRWWQPDLADDVGLHGGQPFTGLGFGGERARCLVAATLFAFRPVVEGSVAPAGQFRDGAERTFVLGGGLLLASLGPLFGCVVNSRELDGVHPAYTGFYEIPLSWMVSAQLEPLFALVNHHTGKPDELVQSQYRAPV